MEVGGTECQSVLYIVAVAWTVDLDDDVSEGALMDNKIQKMTFDSCYVVVMLIGAELLSRRVHVRGSFANPLC